MQTQPISSEQQQQQKKQNKEKYIIDSKNIFNICSVISWLFALFLFFTHRNRSMLQHKKVLKKGEKNDLILSGSEKRIV